MSPRHCSHSTEPRHVEITPIFPIHQVAGPQEASVVILEARIQAAHRIQLLGRDYLVMTIRDQPRLPAFGGRSRGAFLNRVDAKYRASVG